MSDVAIPHDVEPHPITGMYNGKFGLWLFLASEVMLFGALFSTYVLLRVGAAPGTWPMYGFEQKLGAQILNVPLATLNTVVLITSSVTMVLAWAALKANNFAKGRLFLALTFLLAATFLVVKYFEYSAKLTHHHIVLTEPLSDAHGDEISRTITVTTDKGGERTISVVNGHQGEETDDYVMFTPDPVGDEKAEHVAVKVPRNKIQRMSVWGPQASTFLAIYFTLTGLHGLHIIGGMVVILYLIVSGPGLWKNKSDKFTNRVECTGLYWHFVDLVWIFLFPVLYLL